MTAEINQKDLAERVKLIEDMITEGRRTTERWGWILCCGGIAYYVAIFWTSAGHFGAAWPVTMTVAWVMTVIIAMRKVRTRPKTTMGRAVSAIWIAMGVSMMLLFPALSISGRIDEYIMVSVAAAMLGMANAASATSYVVFAVWLRSGLVGDGCVCLLWPEPAGRDCVSGGNFSVFDRIRARLNVRGRAAAQAAGSGTCLKFRLDPNLVIHGKLRLALLSLLSGVEEAQFTWLRARTGATDGNRGAQLMKLKRPATLLSKKNSCSASRRRSTE